MRLTNDGWLRIARLTTICLALLGMGMAAHGQAVATTTVQGTIYLANGQPGGGTLMVSWPSFTTAAGQLVAADRASATIGNDGFVSINLAPNQGSTPAGQYYTAVFYMSDGTVNTQYWIVPAAAQAALSQVQAQLMPAAQAVQAVSKAYVDQAISQATQSALGGPGGVLAGPLFLSGDPSQPLQAADKHYVDSQLAAAVPLAGGNMSGPLTTPGVNGIEVPAGTQQTTLQATINAAGANGAMEIPPTYAGTDTFTNPDGVRVTDLRTTGAQQVERSVKEFGAVCDGVTDDTNALQSAINYAQTHGVALTIPQGTCKTRTLNWHGESIGGLGKQVSALMGFPGQDVLATTPDNPNILSYTRLHDLTIYVDQSQDVSCSQAKGRASAGSCQLSRPMESNTIFSPGGNGLSGTAGSGTAWAVGNCAIAMQATTGAGGNGLKNAQIENLEIVATGTDPMGTQYPGAHSTHTCGLYLAQWPQWSEFKNIDIRGLNTGVAIPALPGTAPAGLLADSNRWQNITIQAAHGFTAAAGCNGIVDDLTAMAGNSAATGEAPTGMILDLQSSQEGWTVRNTVVMPNWNAVQPALTVTTAIGAVSGVTVGSEHGLGWDPYGTTVPVAFSGSCTAHANAAVNSDGSIGAISVTQGGSGCSSTTTASINSPGNWDTAAPVNLIGGQNMTFFAGSLLRGHGGYTVWNASGAQSYGTQVNGGGGNLPGGGSYPAFVANSSVGSTLQVDQFPGADFGAKLQACVNAVNSTFGGTCDARNFTGNQTMSANLTISTPNTTVLLPCATISTANQIIVTAGTRNVALRGCAMRGGSTASGSQGGTAFAFSGTGGVIQVGDPTYAVNTPGFHIDNSVINTTGATSAAAQGLVAYRTQEIDLEDMYFLGNANQTGATLDGTGNYSGGTIRSVQFGGFKTALNAIGHQVANAATTDWMNASTFVRLHIDCPTSNGYPIAGTIGINLQQGDGNTFTGGDVEGCSTALHLGPNAQNNTIVGLRNEDSTNQVVADAGSAYNNWITGGTMFTGQLSDSGTRNSFQDTFHRSFNGMNGDWYGSQQDATVTNHFRLGTGNGNERGLLNEYQTDSGYRWTEGLSDATGGEQFYQILDQKNNVYRLSIGQYNNGQSSTNNQTSMNSAGTGAVVLNSTTNSGTGGVIFGSGGASPSTVATVDNAGNAHYNGTLQVGGTSQSTGTMTVRNNADSEVDYYLWPGLTSSQKGSFTYKDWNGNSQWYLVKDSSNNWALNSALGGLDSFKAYQSTNSGDTYINASNSSGHIRLNYESGSGAETDIYSGSSAGLVASFLGPTAVKLPGLAAGSGHNCLQIDSSGYLTNTGVACGSGSGSGNGTVSSGNTGQIAYYIGSGTTIAGTNAVPLSAGGTGSTSAAGALANLLPGVASDGKQGVTVVGNVAAQTAVSQNSASIGPRYDPTLFGAVGDGVADDTAALQAMANACALGQQGPGSGSSGYLEFPGSRSYRITGPVYLYHSCSVQGTRGRVANGGTADASSPPLIYTAFPNVDSNTASVTTAVIIDNQTQATPIRTAMDPASLGNLQIAQYQITLTTATASTFLPNQFVGLSGCTYAGLNNVVGQVYSSSGNTVIMLYNGNLDYGTYTSETCTAKQTTVAFVFDSLEHSVDGVEDISFRNKLTGGTASSPEGIDIYYSGRADTGVHLSNVWFDSCHLFCGYFAAGAEGLTFDNGTRADWTDNYEIYVRDDGVGGIVNLKAGQWGTGGNSPAGTTNDYGGILVDNGSCNGGTEVINIDGTKFENDGHPMASGFANISMIDCPANNLSTPVQFQLNINSVHIGTVYSANIIQVSPPNDLAAQIHIQSSLLNPGTGTVFTGIPDIQTTSMEGSTGIVSDFNYSPALTSWGRTDTPGLSHRAPMQDYGDRNTNNLYQWGQFASPFLETPPDFSSLTSGRTLLKGEVIAPPAYFQCGTTGCNRYALDVVQATGTVGTLNGGSTTCTAAGGTAQMTCSSDVGLSDGQIVVLAGNATTHQIKYMDDHNPTAVVVTTLNNIAAATNATLSYSAPVLGSEMQLITKASAAPTTGTCGQGDFIENSSATAGGIAGWSCTTAGSPGTWTPIYLTTPTSGPLCRIIAPLTNTGSTSRQQLLSCKVPGGTVDATGTLELKMAGSSCSASGTPYSGCTTANTGTCGLFAALGTSPTSNSPGIAPLINGTAAKSTYSHATLQMQNSTGAQWVDVNGSTGSTSVNGGSSYSTSLDMTADTYLNVFMTNSVPGDTCGVDQVLLTYTP